MSLHGLTTKKELSRKLIELAITGFAGTLSPIEHETIQAQITLQLEDDPYLEGKLDRLAGLVREPS